MRILADALEEFGDIPSKEQRYQLAQQLGVSKEVLTVFESL